MSTGTPAPILHAMVHNVLAPASDTQNAPAPPRALPRGRAGVARGSSLIHPFFWETAILVVSSPSVHQRAAASPVRPSRANGPVTRTPRKELNAEPCCQYSLSRIATPRGVRAGPPVWTSAGCRSWLIARVIQRPVWRRLIEPRVAPAIATSATAPKIENGASTPDTSATTPTTAGPTTMPTSLDRRTAPTA